MTANAQHAVNFAKKSMGKALVFAKSIYKQNPIWMLFYIALFAELIKMCLPQVIPLVFARMKVAEIHYKITNFDFVFCDFH